MKKTKILSILLSLILLFGVVSPGTLAIETDVEDGTGGNENSGMEIHKTAEANSDGTYTITLEAFATGSKVISTAKKDIPTDIVLVLDQSGSMADCIVCGKEINSNNQTHTAYITTDSVDTSGTYYIKSETQYIRVYYCDGAHWNWGEYNCEGGAGWYTSWYGDDHTTANKIIPKTADNPNGTQLYIRTTEKCTPRLDSLKSAIASFAENVAKKAKGEDGEFGTADDINHRIAVVGFASGNSNSPRYGNTELFIGSNQYNYSNDAENYYASAFQNMNTQTGYNNVIASKNALAASGATRVDLGVEMANGIFDKNPISADTQRNRVMIVFTDGQPTSYRNYESTVADNAITNADVTKNTYKATVYSIGIFEGANATSAGNKNGTDTEKANWFMQNISSNNGTVQNPSYYLSAGDSASLDNIFQQISQNIESGGSATTLNSETVIKDIISDQFQLPANAAEKDITLETWACTGKIGDTYTWSKNNNAMGAAASINGDQVSVTGFDFAANYVGTVTENGTTTYRGNKLVIKFKVEAKEGFLGGNNVYTNTSAGVYENSTAKEPVLSFERPQVNVPIKDVTVDAADKNVYLLGSLTADEMKAGTVVECGNVSLDLSKATDADKPYGLEPWQTEYVNITVEVQDKDGKAVTNLTSLTDDTTYQVYVKITPKDGASSVQGTPATAQEASDKGNIHVFKPELTFKDSEVYYGANAPTDAELASNDINTEWKHGNTKATDVTMIGEALELTKEYTPDSDKTQAGKVNTKQDIGVDVNVKIGAKNVTEHTTFAHQDCSGQTCTPQDPWKFWLHVKTCQLTITKQGGNPDESYVFTVYKDGKPYSEVSIYGNGDETIYELPVGEYTVTEDAGWSWRFSAKSGNEILSAENPLGSIICTNTANGKNHWLNGFSDIVKNIFGVKAN